MQKIKQGAMGSPITSTSGCVQLLLRTDDAALKTGGESTGVFVLLTESSVIGASVGDSEAWVISEQEIDVLTKGQRRKPCLGTGGASPIGFHRPALIGSLLIASDGLFKYTSAQAIADVVRHVGDLDVAAQKLVELVRYPSGELPDDLSIILVR